MAEKIEFKNRGVYEECTLSLTGPTIVEICREKEGCLSVYGNLEGMEKARILSIQYDKNIIFKLDIPDCVAVTVESETHVLEAKIEVIG